MAVPERNQQLAALFRSIAELLAAQRANPYRVRAYRRGADALLALDEDVAGMAQRHALEAIDGIGSELSQKIEEFLRTGKILTLETLRMPLPDRPGWQRVGLSTKVPALLPLLRSIRSSGGEIEHVYDY